MRPTLALIAALLVATPAAADLTIFAEFANIEVSATSSCPVDTPPPPDFLKHFVPRVIGDGPHLIAEMVSGCGWAQMSGDVYAAVAPGLLSGGFTVSTGLDSHGGGYASLSATISFRVDTPTAYTFTCAGRTGFTGDPDIGSMQITLQGGSISHSSNMAAHFDLEWSGEFEPGIDYTLQMHASAERSTRAVGNEYLFMNGTTGRGILFDLAVGGDVVENSKNSFSRIKSAY